MKRSIIFLFSLILFADQSFALNKGKFGEFGSWNIDVNKSGTCILNRSFDNKRGYFLFFFGMKRGEISNYLAFTHSSIPELKIGTIYPVEVSVDGWRWKNAASAEVYSRSAVQIPITIKSGFLQNFIKGNTLKISTAKKDFIIPLSGSAAATRIYWNCFQEQAESNRATGNPFEVESSPSRTSNPFQ